ncbi:MAG: 16S rRNA (guanine(966)-N(2))-methyltransferase RsmD [Lachnospiraceae bacterium]|nr:16S rRNA (guanine(966)-N(2))-methyltransferase RsmD [Lachnospiraceae bacterium]
MRVIAGEARRLKLKAPDGYETRPTSDKIKETLFNMLMPYIYSDTMFLDLFAGSGGIGIEALSRGAKYAVFVDNSKKACACITENLTNTRLSDRARVINSDVLTSLKRLEGTGVYDIIFMDPPYDLGLEKDTLRYLASSPLVSPETLIIIEASKDTVFDDIEDLGFEVVKYKEYKNNCHLFIKPSGK